MQGALYCKGFFSGYRLMLVQHVPGSGQNRQSMRLKWG